MIKNPHLAPSSSEAHLFIFTWPSPGERDNGLKMEEVRIFFNKILINSVVGF